MTIREAQELVRFIDEKQGRTPEPSSATKRELSKRFRKLLSEANDAGIDLTGALVDSLGDKNQ